MATNGLTIANGGADVEITDGTDTYGYKYAKGSQVVETRGSSFVGQIATGGTTYQDAEPFKRKVYDNFSGGMGQESDNKTFGGVGIGGDDSKYFYGDCYTLRGGYLLPGMARNMVYNTTGAAQQTPISDGLDPLGGDEMEVPRGVLPVGAYAYPTGTFTCVGAPTITNIRMVLYRSKYLSGGGAGNVTLTLSRVSDSVTMGTYNCSINLANTPDFTGFKWYTFVLATGTGVLANGIQYQLSIPSSNNYVVGSYIGASNVFLPYFQLMTSATPFKYFANPIQKVEQINNGSGTYANIALHSTGFFNTAATGTAGTAGTSPERLYSSGTYIGSLWFNSLLYISTSTGIGTWNYAQASGNLGPTTAIDTNGRLSSMVGWGGKIYGVGTDQSIYKWDGLFPIVVGTNLVLIVAANTIGQTGTNVNKLFIFQGNLWVIKSEGLFQLYADPVVITTDPGNTPRIVPIVADLPSVHQDTGKWYAVHQGMIYFNYRDRIYQVMPNAAGAPQVTVLSLPMPWYSLSYYHYVNGITSDGVNLYVSWNNLGVFAFTNQTWHPITEFYEQIAVEGQASGLRWVPNPTSAPDNLFVGDGRTVVQLPVPSAARPYTTQIYQNHQNKCGYLITSGWDGDLAEVPKYIHSLVMRAVPSGFSYKVVAVAKMSTDAPTFQNLIIKSWHQGLVRDNWLSPQLSLGGSHITAAVTTKVQVNGTAVANTLAPTCWAYTDFDSVFYSSEKLAATTTDTTTDPDTTDVLTNPPKFVKTAFIIFFWNPTLLQHASTNLGADLMAIDSLVVKYQPPLDYIASYQVQLDFKSAGQGKPSTRIRTVTQIDTDAEWLRSKTGAHSPLQVTMKLNSTTTKSFLAFLQNPTTTYGRISEETNNGSLVVKGKALNIISVQSEYGSV